MIIVYMRKLINELFSMQFYSKLKRDTDEIQKNEIYKLSFAWFKYG